MLKKSLLILLIGLCYQAAIAQEKHFSLGADLLGTRISSEIDVTTKSSARVDIGFVFADAANSITINPEYYFNKIDNQVNLGDGHVLIPYHGPGLELIFGENGDQYAFEFMWGLKYDNPESPFKVFVDAGPYVIFDPNTVVTLTSSFGVRYKF